MVKAVVHINAFLISSLVNLSSRKHGFKPTSAFDNGSSSGKKCGVSYIRHPAACLLISDFQLADHYLLDGRHPHSIPLLEVIIRLP